MRRLTCYHSTFHPLGVDKWVATCIQMAAITTHSSGALWWTLRGKRRCGVFAGKTVWSTLERLRGEVFTMKRYTNLRLPLSRVQTGNFLAQVSVASFLRQKTVPFFWIKKLAPETGRNRTRSISGKFLSWNSATDWTIDWRSDFSKAHRLTTFLNKKLA